MEQGRSRGIYRDGDNARHARATDRLNYLRKSSVKWLAIDPGLTGALCIYGPHFSFESGMRWHVFDTPTFIDDRNNRQIDVPVLRDWIMRLSPDRAMIESSWPRPTDGAIQAFRFGRSFGTIQAVVSCCGVPIQYVAPQRWKKYHGLIGKKKDDSRIRALQIAPELTPLLSRKKDHGRAEAVLIALYADMHIL